MDPSTAEGRRLLSFIERIERLEENKREISEDIKDVYAEAKGTGYDVKIMRKIITIRKQDKQKRDEEEALLELYMHALGMLADTPLGEAAVVRDFGRPVGVNPTTAMREQRERDVAAEKKRRDRDLAADVERRRIEAEKFEAKRVKAQGALRTAYVEDARKAGFDAYDGEERVDPEAYAGDEEALSAWREGWDGAAEQAAKFKAPKKRGGQQPSASA